MSDEWIKKIADSLEDYESPVAEGLFERIKIDERKKRRFFFWWILAGVFITTGLTAGVISYMQSRPEQGHDYVSNQGLSEKDENAESNHVQALQTGSVSASETQNEVKAGRADGSSSDQVYQVNNEEDYSNSGTMPESVNKALGVTGERRTTDSHNKITRGANFEDKSRGGSTVSRSDKTAHNTEIKEIESKAAIKSKKAGSNNKTAISNEAAISNKAISSNNISASWQEAGHVAAKNQNSSQSQSQSALSNSLTELSGIKPEGDIADNSLLQGFQNRNFSLADLIATKKLFIKVDPFTLKDPPVKCYSFRSPSRRPKYYIDVMGTAGYSMNTIKSDFEYVKYKELMDSLETPRYVTGGKVNMGIILNNFWAIESGIEYRMIREKFEYVNEREKRTVINQVFDINGELVRVDTQYVYGVRTVANYNNYQYINIPLRVGATWHTNKWVYGVRIGANINVAASRKGRILDPNNRVYDVEADYNQIFRKTIGMSLDQTFQIGRRIGDNLYLMLEPNFNFGLENIYTDSALLSKKRTSFMLNFGVRYITGNKKYR